MVKRIGTPKNKRSSKGLVALQARAQEAQQRRRRAKQQAKEARKLLKQARKVAKRAKAELQQLSKKLKKLLADASRQNSGKKPRPRRRASASRA